MVLLSATQRARKGVANPEARRIAQKAEQSLPRNVTRFHAPKLTAARKCPTPIKMAKSAMMAGNALILIVSTPPSQPLPVHGSVLTGALAIVFYLRQTQLLFA
jgi:hypothetical protein